MIKIATKLLIPVLCLLTIIGCATQSTAPQSDAASLAPAVTGEVSAKPNTSAEPEEIPTPTLEPTREPVTLLLAAAASLETVYTSELIPLFEELYPWIKITGTYDSSGKLQTQIEEGLEADIFISASTKQMTALSDSGLVDATTVLELLENQIVLIAHIDSASDIASFENITKADTIALGDPESVPAGQYAQEALTSLALWDSIQDKTSWGTNVTEVLNWVAEGSADVGIVYATDAAQITDKVKVIASAPEGSLAKKVIYPVGIVTDTKNKEASELFVNFLQSPTAMQIFINNGFILST